MENRRTGETFEWGRSALRLTGDAKTDAVADDLASGNNGDVAGALHALFEAALRYEENVVRFEDRVGDLALHHFVEVDGDFLALLGVVRMAHDDGFAERG